MKEEAASANIRKCSSLFFHYPVMRWAVSRIRFAFTGFSR